MASLEGVLANIPGYGGYLAQRQQNEQAGAQELQQFGAVQGVLANLAAQQQKQKQAQNREAYVQAVRALGPNPDQAALSSLAARFNDDPGETMKTMQSSLDRQSAQRIAQTNADTASADRRHISEESLKSHERVATLNAQQAMERVRERAAEGRITQEQARADMERIQAGLIRLTASLRPAPQVQPLVPVMGDDGQPTLVERKDAVGRVPAGAGSKAEATLAGKSDVDKDVIKLKDAIDRLRSGGGITDTSKGIVPNLKAAISSSAVGQVAGGAVGSKNQSARNDLLMIRPSLLRSIMQATGMSAKQMDSNAELKLWLSTATDPNKDYQANVTALNNIAEKYGSGGFLDKPEGEQPTAPKAAATVNTVTLPDGRVKTFTSPGAAAAFKRAAGIKD